MNLLQSLKPSCLCKLPEQLYEQSVTAPLQHTRFCQINHLLLNQLSISAESFENQPNLDLLSGRLNELSHPVISTVYAGHQFGIYTSKLGDGRVHTLGDINTADGTRWELQIKGAGPTSFSRGNTGRVTIAEAITEYLGSVALAGLGIATSHSLAIVTQDKASNECIIARLAPSHLRFGHFEYCHNQQDHIALKSLADYVIDTYYPELNEYNQNNKYLNFLYAVTKRTAQLVAQWQAYGFVHSVMNTDNMSVIGLTLDLGVFGFMEAYAPEYSANENDDTNRYAYNQQVDVARWNCLALAEAMIELLPAKRIPSSLLRIYRQSYNENYLSLMCKKLGMSKPVEGDQQLINNLLTLLKDFGKDYHRFFRQLAIDHTQGHVHLLSDNTHWNYAFKQWLSDYTNRLQKEETTDIQQQQIMLANNPRYILRKHLLERAIQQAKDNSDFSLMQRLINVLQTPFEKHSQDSDLT